MAWNRVETMDQRIRFVLDVEAGTRSKQALCRKYGISRPTADKWLKRYELQGLDGLRGRSSAPHSCPHKTSAVWEERVVRARLRHPHWGPKKLRAVLLRHHDPDSVPVASTIGEILKRRGLVRGRRRRRKGPVVLKDSLREANRPNAVWAIDFKGWFRTADGCRCDPLTVTDLYSRYVLCVEALPNQRIDRVFAALKRVFRSYGLPGVIRSDNGGPFASWGVAGLSRLSAWWILLGIRPEYIDRGCPYQNGEHERMHATLKDEACRPPSAHLRAQQRRFNLWRDEFNGVRPHEALNMAVPASLYRPSDSAYDGRLRQPDYPDDYAVRRIRRNGAIKWKGRERFIGSALCGIYVGLRQVEEGWDQVYLSNVLLGSLYDADAGGIRPTVPIPKTQLPKEKDVTHVPG